MVLTLHARYVPDRTTVLPRDSPDVRRYHRRSPLGWTCPSTRGEDDEWSAW